MSRLEPGEGPRLIGREREVALIDALLARARSSSAALLFVGGPRLGKSALLDLAASKATGSGFRVLRATGVEAESELAFAGLYQLLRPAMAELERLPTRQAAALRCAFGIGQENTPDRFLIGLATLTLLARFADQPLLLVLDDVHWLDQGSLEALAFAVRRFRAEPIAVVIASRAEDVVRPFGEAPRRMMLEPLGDAAARQLLAAQGPSCMEGIDRKPERTNRFLFKLLGVAELTIDGRSIAFRTRKSLALLAYLAVDPGPHSRERLADLLWPDTDVVDARASLRTALNYVRQALGTQNDRVLVATRDTLGVLPGSIRLDVDALTEARRLLRQSADARLRHQVEAAAKRYRGPFLAGMLLPDAPDYDSWVDSQRAYWRGLEAEVLDRLASLQIAAGEPAAAFSTLERLTQLSPDEELAWRRLIETCLEAEDRAGARRAWNAYCRTVAELKATAGTQMAELGERVLGVSSAVAPPPTGFEDLDLGAAPFVGREREWAHLKASHRRMQRGRTEVIVLQGASGAGKTRLVSEFIGSLRDAEVDVIRGRAFEHLDGLPYAAVVGGLRARLEEENAPDDLLSDLWLAELARLLPELRERYPDLPIRQEDSLGRGRIFEAVSRLGMALARRKPLLLFVDDVQWTDSGTRDLLRYAVRRWAETGTQVLLILTAANDQRPDAGLEQWLAGLRRETTTRLLRLHPLQPQDVTHLVGILAATDEEDLPSAGPFGQWLVDRTGGRPLPVVQTLRGMVEEGALRLRPMQDNRWAIELPDIDAIPELAFTSVG